MDAVWRCGRCSALFRVVVDVDDGGSASGGSSGGVVVIMMMMMIRWRCLNQGFRVARRASKPQSTHMYIHRCV